MQEMSTSAIEQQMDEMGAYGWDMRSSTLQRHSLVLHPTPPLILTVLFKRRTA
jgi:hypothetical protein